MKHSTTFALIACLSISIGCGRPADLSSGPSQDSQKLPFDRQPQTGRISPTQTLVPSATRIPEGTAITVSLEHSLSSASAHPTDNFNAVLDDPIVVDGQTLLAAGIPVTGHVLDARGGKSPRDPGYLRIALTSLSMNGKQLPITTSSLFAKAGSREGPSAAEKNSASKEMVLAPGRRLSFRLTQNLDLQ
jgi:hypothetical protein